MGQRERPRLSRQNPRGKREGKWLFSPATPPQQPWESNLRIRLHPSLLALRLGSQDRKPLPLPARPWNNPWVGRLPCRNKFEPQVRRQRRCPSPVRNRRLRPVSRLQGHNQKNPTLRRLNPLCRRHRVWDCRLLPNLHCRRTQPNKLLLRPTRRDLIPPHPPPPIIRRWRNSRAGWECLQEQMCRSLPIPECPCAQRDKPLLPPHARDVTLLDLSTQPIIRLWRNFQADWECSREQVCRRLRYPWCRRAKRINLLLRSRPRDVTLLDLSPQPVIRR